MDAYDYLSPADYEDWLYQQYAFWWPVARNRRTRRDFLNPLPF